ncbi:hypothetical protein DUI87_02263 [Hirundo rustica rustica]|uniref:Uncharacterized protein n=1 Tax=Hirundo rustica rustica TaxID=333673 RepID=A0A3M0L7B1_HIRRU|nr:hypothetical protein DUI87_02263 [Hirundo rustica rustica]
MMSPALGLPDLSKPFELFVHERQHLALGVLTQKLGTWKKTCGLFLQTAGQHEQRMAGMLESDYCNCSTDLRVQEAHDQTEHNCFVPRGHIHIKAKGHLLSPSRMLKYQVVLLEQDDVELKTTAAINPAMFLNTKAVDDGALAHECLQTMEQVYSSRTDLEDKPIKNLNLELFADGSSFVKDGRWMAGYTVVTATEIVETQSLPISTSVQNPEIIVLKQAMNLAVGKRVNIWIDSRYAFGVIRAHGAIWKERGLLSARGSAIKHKEEILKLLEEIQKPKEVAVMHRKAHQSGQTNVIEGNQLADKAARGVAEKGILVLVPQNKIDISEFKPNYNSEVQCLANISKATKNQERWWVTDSQQVIVPPPVMRKIMGKEHKTNWGIESMISSLPNSVLSVGMTGIAKSVIVKCPICLKNNPINRKRLPPRTVKQGNSPGDYWQNNFSELRSQNGSRYLLVLADTFSKWPEAFPCHINKAREVVKIMLKEIMLRFGVPLGMSSDRGPHFIADVVQQLSKTLGVKWDLHTPQSSGTVERMNQTLK